MLFPGVVQVHKLLKKLLIRRITNLYSTSWPWHRKTRSKHMHSYYLTVATRRFKGSPSTLSTIRYRYILAPYLRRAKGDHPDKCARERICCPWATQCCNGASSRVACAQDTTRFSSNTSLGDDLQNHAVVVHTAVELITTSCNCKARIRNRSNQS